MIAADRSKVRQLDRALAWDWEEPCELFGYTDQMFGGELSHIRLPSDFRNDWLGGARQSLASNPFE